jgi:Deuterolysin metalloprotease (M35) family.
MNTLRPLAPPHATSWPLALRLWQRRPARTLPLSTTAKIPWDSQYLPSIKALCVYITYINNPNSCETNVLAYTLPSQNVIANCDIYYSDLPALTNKCHNQDQATTTLHEFTHAPGVYSPGTEDNGYGYSAATALSSADAVLNADSYALYANG